MVRMLAAVSIPCCPESHNLAQVGKLCTCFSLISYETSWSYLFRYSKSACILSTSGDILTSRSFTYWCQMFGIDCDTLSKSRSFIMRGPRYVASKKNLHDDCENKLFRTWIRRLQYSIRSSAHSTDSDSADSFKLWFKIFEWMFIK